MAIPSSVAEPVVYSPEYRQALLSRFAELPEKQQAAFLEKATVELRGNTTQIMAAMESLLKIDGREQVSASTEVAQAQKIAEEVVAKGQNASAVATTGAQVSATSAVVNLATNEVHANQAQQAESEKAMHKETVAKAEGREAPASEPTNPFAAALANAGVSARDVIAPSMLQHRNADASRVVGSAQQRGADGHQVG